MLPEPDANNVWRLETPGNEGWLRSARPDDADKYYMASADGHVQEPGDLWVTRMDARFRDRLPGIIVDEKGDQFQKTEGFRATKLQNVPLEGHELLRNKSGRTPEDRIRDLALDGVDAEVLFPNKGLTIWATRDAAFSQAMCRVYNDWAWETFGPYNDTLVALACVATADLDGAIAEIQRCATLGFRGLSLPCKPVFGPPNHEDLNYNLPRVRAALGLHRRRRPPDHVPRLDRARSAHRPQPGRGGHQLRRPLAGADDGAARSTSVPRAPPSATPTSASARSRPASAGCRGR